jgi:hypothetical protein
MEDNGSQILIVDSSQTGYYIEGFKLRQITDTDFISASSVTFQDGYFIVTEKDTGKIWVSGLYDATSWDSLDFATAESKPDYATRVLSSQRELWIFGEETIEPYYNSGNADFPFERIAGSTMPIGVVAPASVAEHRGVFYWLSNTLQVMKNTGYLHTPISTTTIDYQIASYITVSDAIGYIFNMEGHAFYVLIFPTVNVTWVHDITTGYWFEWESYNTRESRIPWSRHRSNCHTNCWGKEFVGDYETGSIYYLSMNTYTDNGHTIRRIRSSQYTSANNHNVIYHRLALDFETGVGLAGNGQGSEPTVLLDWSNDGGHTWSNNYSSSIGKVGEYESRAYWTRLGMARSRVFRVTMSDPVKPVIMGAYADMEVLAV